MNRKVRTEQAQDTLNILRTGQSVTESGPVRLPGLAAMRQGTRLFTPEQGEDLREALRRRRGSFQTTCEVTPETTFAAARRLSQRASALAALNFASAKNPGGGFLGGAQAQEEDLCRGSGLYFSLTSPQAEPYYAVNRQSHSALYTDHLIYSPQVPIFRDDAGRLLPAPVLVNVITAPAPNAGAVAQSRPEQLPQVLPTLRERARRVLGVAAWMEQTHLVLGAWGCGVFRNDPAVLARTFRELLEGEAQGAFEHVTFAVFDPRPQHPTLGAFRRELESLCLPSSTC